MKRVKVHINNRHCHDCGIKYPFKDIIEFSPHLTDGQIEQAVQEEVLDCLEYSWEVLEDG
jgi:hypothetical protein